MKMNKIEGKRVYPDKNGNLSLGSSHYGKDKNGVWFVSPPDCGMGSIEKHDVVEHEDGTITVSPSILLNDGRRKWHGYLERGIWREC